MSASPEGDGLLFELGILISRSRRLVWTAAARDLETNGFSMLAWVLAAFLSKRGAATQREIAEAVGQHPAGVSRLIDDLIRRRMVRRRRDKADLRRVRIALTARGLAMYEAGRPHVLGALQSTLAPLSSAEQQRLYRLLEKLAPPATAISPSRGTAGRDPAGSR